MHASWLLIPALIFCAGCATDSTVSFQTDGKAEVALVNWDNLAAEGQRLGETPLTISAKDVDGKVVRISQDKKIPQYWVLTCDDRRSKLEARLKMTDLVGPEALAKAQDPKVDPTLPGNQPMNALTPAVLNQSHRLLLQAYEALVSTDYGLARQLAGQLSTQMPTLASPFIIIGLSYMQSGEREQARGAFAKAVNLDPTDQATKELMKLTQF